MEGADYRIRLDLENRVPPKIDQVVKGLNKVERAAESAGRKVSALERVIGKILPGGGLGNALGDVAGGGIASTAGVGTAFFAATWMKGLVEEARAMDLAGKAVEENMRRMSRFSDGAIDGLASISYGIETLWRTLRKGEAERASFWVSASKSLFGAAGMAFFDSPFGNLIPKGLRDILSQGALNIATQGQADLMGGSGRQDAAAAEARLKNALEHKKPKKGSGSGPNSSISIPNVDELARIGLFRGGMPMLQGQMTELQRATNDKLDLMNRKIENLAPRIAQHL